MHLTIIVNLLSFLSKQLTSCEDIIMLKPKSKFHGTYQEGCIQQAIPSTLLQFVSILEHVADIKSQLKFSVSKTDSAIAQLLQCNYYAKCKEGHRLTCSQKTEILLSLSTSDCLSTHKRDKKDWWKSLMNMVSESASDGVNFSLYFA